MMRVHVTIGAFFRFALWAMLLVADVAAAQDSGADPASAVIQTLLKEGKHPRLRWGSFPDYQARLTELYKQNALSPLWVKEGKPTSQAITMIASLDEADDKGLNSADYDAELLRKWLNAPELSGGNPREVGEFDVALSLSAMRYLSNLYLGRVNPRTVEFKLDTEPKKVDLPNLVQKIAQSDRPKAMIDDMEPRLPIYEALKEALVRYRALAKETEVPKFSFPVKFGPGGHHKDIPALRRLLLALGDLKEITPGTENSEIYDPDLAAAVKSFQQRHGLGADGVIGKGTLARLNVPLADRVRQIQFGLERLRWLPDDVKGLYLIVNIPSFQLYGSRDGEGFGQHDIQMNVIVGEAMDGHNTPVFHSEMTYVTFHPYWNVPDTIAAKELIPAIRRNPGYLARNNMELVTSFSDSAKPYAPTAANLERLAAGGLKIRQKPGLKNALGLVKFTFPNNNNVYLHSTPAKGLFQRDRRDFSHGCIRVQDPTRLAEWVLAEQPDWTRERIETAMAAPIPKMVTLKRPIPVYIFYSTVLADKDGQVSFYEDIYGHDRKLEAMLARGFPYPS
jgi:murein L,D-transpeptidase YcbB/YkuD